jgi:glutathionyl-hydroquinone reductase
MTERTNRRKFVLPSLTDFQRKLETFFQGTTKNRIEEKQRYSAYVDLICDYYKKGMTMREISASTGVSTQTVSYWVRKKGIRHRKTNSKENQTNAS